jgi:hypothetical protein
MIPADRQIENRRKLSRKPTMKLPFSLNWGSPKKVTQEQIKYQAVDAETLRLLDTYSAQVLQMLHTNVDATLGFGEKAVAILSTDLEAGRRNYTAEKKRIIANLYGAFLGKAIIHSHLGGTGKWITYNGDTGILFNETSNTTPLMAFPITRAFKHIEQGEEYSLLSYFQAIPASISSAPKLSGP